MDGWSKKLEDKILEMRMSEYEQHAQKDRLIKLKTKPYVFSLAVIFVVLSLIQMILLFVTFNSSLTFKDGQASLLWNYKTSPTLNQTTYELSTFGTALIIITCLMIITLFVFLFHWIKDPVFVGNGNKKMKRLWLSTLVSSIIAFSVFLILDLVVISIFNDGTNYPQNIVNIKSGDSLGLAFQFVKNDSQFAWIITASPLAIFVSVMQLIAFLVSIVWLLAFTCSINMNLISKKNKN